MNLCKCFFFTDSKREKEKFQSFVAEFNKLLIETNNVRGFALFQREDQNGHHLYHIEYPQSLQDRIQLFCDLFSGIDCDPRAKFSAKLIAGSI